MVSNKNIQDNDEIDFLEIILTTWNNKLKIFLITCLAVVLMLIYQLITEPKYKASTEIRPITVFDQVIYENYNNYFKEVTYKKDIEEINKSFLLKLFIDKLNEYLLLISGIKKFELIKKSDYEDQKKYEDAVSKLASLINFNPPIIDKKKMNKKIIGILNLKQKTKKFGKIF